MSVIRRHFSLGQWIASAVTAGAVMCFAAAGAGCQNARTDQARLVEPSWSAYTPAVETSLDARIASTEPVSYRVPIRLWEDQPRQSPDSALSVVETAQ